MSKVNWSSPKVFWTTFHHSQVVQVINSTLDCWTSPKMVSLLLPLPLWHLFLKTILFIHLFLFLAMLGLPCYVGFSLVVASEATLQLWCSDFPLQWLLLLWSMGSRACGFQLFQLSVCRASQVAQKQRICLPGDFKGRGLDPWVRKIPWRRKWQPTLVFLPGKSHG